MHNLKVFIRHTLCWRTQDRFISFTNVDKIVEENYEKPSTDLWTLNLLNHRRVFSNLFK